MDPHRFLWPRQQVDVCWASGFEALIIRIFASKRWSRHLSQKCCFSDRCSTGSSSWLEGDRARWIVKREIPVAYWWLTGRSHALHRICPSLQAPAQTSHQVFSQTQTVLQLWRLGLVVRIPRRVKLILAKILSPPGFWAFSATWMAGSSVAQKTQALWSICSIASSLSAPPCARIFWALLAALGIGGIFQRLLLLRLFVWGWSPTQLLHPFSGVPCPAALPIPPCKQRFAFWHILVQFCARICLVWVFAPVFQVWAAIWVRRLSGMMSPILVPRKLLLGLLFADFWHQSSSPKPCPRPPSAQPPGPCSTCSSVFVL